MTGKGRINDILEGRGLVIFENNNIIVNGVVGIDLKIIYLLREEEIRQAILRQGIRRGNRRVYILQV